MSGLKHFFGTDEGPSMIPNLLHDTNVIYVESNPIYIVYYRLNSKDLIYLVKI